MIFVEFIKIKIKRFIEICFSQDITPPEFKIILPLLIYNNILFIKKQDGTIIKKGGVLMQKIKIAQIGLNIYSHSTDVFKTLKKQKDKFEIVGYVLPENEKQRLSDKLSVFDGYEELSLDEVLNNPEIEAVAIETDEIYLTKYALMAAKAHKHIHMEKPGGRELCDFEELISIMKKTGKVFHTGYMYRYNPLIKEMLSRVKNGEFGEIISVEAQMNCWLSQETRQWLKDLPSGMMFFLGCHLLDLVLTLQGKPEKIIPLNKSTHLDGVTADDFSMAVLEYEKGYSFIKTTAVEVSGFARRQLVINCENATLELNPLEWYVDGEKLVTKCVLRTAKENWHEKGVTGYSEPCSRLGAMLDGFYKMCTEEIKNPYTLDYELDLYKLILETCNYKGEGK